MLRYFKMASTTNTPKDDFNHAAAADTITKKLTKCFPNGTVKVTSPKNNSYLNVELKNFVGDESDFIINIKASQRTSSLHPKSNYKGMYCIQLCLKDGTGLDQFLFSESNEFDLGNSIMLKFSEYTDLTKYSHGLITFYLKCDIDDLNENIQSVIKKIVCAGVTPVETVKETSVKKVAVAKPVASKAIASKAVSNKVSFSNIIAASKSSIKIDEIYVEEDEVTDAFKSQNMKSKDFKATLDSNASKLEELKKLDTQLALQSAEIEKNMAIMFKQIDENNKKREDIKKSILNIETQEDKMQEKIKEEAEKLLALLKPKQPTPVAAPVAAPVAEAVAEAVEDLVASDVSSDSVSDTSDVAPVLSGKKNKKKFKKFDETTITAIQKKEFSLETKCWASL